MRTIFIWDLELNEKCWAMSLGIIFSDDFLEAFNNFNLNTLTRETHMAEIIEKAT